MLLDEGFTVVVLVGTICVVMTGETGGDGLIGETTAGVEVFGFVDGVGFGQIGILEQSLLYCGCWHKVISIQIPAGCIPGCKGTAKRNEIIYFLLNFVKVDQRNMHFSITVSVVSL